MKSFFTSLALALVAAPLAVADSSHRCAAAAPVAPVVDFEPRIEALLSKLTLDEKIDLFGGDETGFNSRGVARLGIPPIRMSDGPVGVRVGASTAFPVSLNMAATWDIGLIQRFGVALGEETRAKGKDAILGPCVGIGRFPIGGRNFEAFGEDSFLSARMAVSVIQGVQSRRVIATVKHFACNDQEWERTNNDVLIDERTLHETHLVPFEAAVKEGGVWMVMSAYNSVNGQHMSENARLLTGVLKHEWGFQGLVVSDWVSVYSAVGAANNGLDIEMPQPMWFGEKLREAVRAGTVPVSVIDDKVRRHLRVRFLAGLFENPAPPPDESVVRSEAHRTLAREMAVESLVLLKNDGILPLAKTAVKSVAVVGPNAAVARAGGGGSSGISPWVSVSPFAGLRAALGNGAAIATAPGVELDNFKAVPLPSSFLHTPDGKSEGLRGEYFSTPDFAGKPAFVRVDKGVDFDFKGGGPGGGIGGSNYSIRWTGTFTPTETRAYDFAIGSDDGSWLYLDDKLIADNGGSHGEIYVPARAELEAGHSYRIRIDYHQGGGDASMRLGWKDPKDVTKVPTIAEAVAIARTAEIAVLCVGYTAAQESEGVDLNDIELIRGQDQLVQEVLAANPNTIVVVYGGVPVSVKPWLARARAVVAALYPGQEGGTALASLLLGERNFSGKLPFSYIQDKAESPGMLHYRDPDRKVPYAEGVFVGYKYYDAHHVEPLFPFGFGLSYTSFAYSNLVAKANGAKSFEVSVTVTNRGKVAGDEIVQLYVEPPQSRLPRPLRELKGFARVGLVPGESKTVTIPLSERSFSYYDPTQPGWVSEPGTYVIQAAASSRDLRLATTVTLP